MRIVVTGSKGFIGSHLVARLRRDGAEVVGVDRRAADGGGDRRLDLSDPRHRDGVADVVGGADAVFHLAARPGVRDPAADAHQLRIRHNVVATRNLLEATPAEVPVVVTSSSSVYGSSIRVDGVLRASREDDPLAPAGGYARSKVAVEALCEERRRSGGRVAVVRPFTVVGERQRPDMALAQWISAALEGRPLTLLGAADRVRDVTDVDDVVEGLIRVLVTGYEGVVNLGTGVGRTLSELVRAVTEVTGTPGPVVLRPGSSEEATATLADVTRCSSVLGFVPSTDVEGVVARMLAVHPGVSEAAS